MAPPKRTPPADPSDLAALNGTVMRSRRTARIRQWIMRGAAGAEMPATLIEAVVVNDPTAMREAISCGSFRPGTPTPARSRSTGHRWFRVKPRVFVDLVADAFKRQRLAERFAGSLG